MAYISGTKNTAYVRQAFGLEETWIGDSLSSQVPCRTTMHFRRLLASDQGNPSLRHKAALIMLYYWNGEALMHHVAPIGLEDTMASL